MKYLIPGKYGKDAVRDSIYSNKSSNAHDANLN
jgi:hypothetical protein